MNPVRAEQVKEQLRDHQAKPSGGGQIAVVGDDVGRVASEIEALTGLPFAPVSPGLYRQETGALTLLIVARSNLPDSSEPGAYAVIRAKREPANSMPMELAGEELHVICQDVVRFMVSAD